MCDFQFSTFVYLFVHVVCSHFPAWQRKHLHLNSISSIIMDGAKKFIRRTSLKIVERKQANERRKTLEEEAQKAALAASLRVG